MQENDNIYCNVFLLTDRLPCSFLKIFKNKTFAIKFQDVIFFVHIDSGQWHNTNGIIENLLSISKAQILS